MLTDSDVLRSSWPGLGTYHMTKETRCSLSLFNACTFGLLLETFDAGLLRVTEYFLQYACLLLSHKQQLNCR